MPNPIDNEELYNAIVLGGVSSPGVVKLSGHNRKANWDVKSTDGQKGASTTLKDIPPIAFDAEFTLTDIADFDAWEAFRDLIKSTISGQKPRALDIYHPDLAENDVNSVCQATIGGREHDGKGGQKIKVTFQEYRPPAPAGGSPKGAASKNPNKTDPDADALAELQRLVDQYKGVPPALIPHPESEAPER